MTLALDLNTPIFESPRADKPDPSRLRDQLLRRLVDVTATPASQVSPHERAMAADLLSGLLEDAGPEWRVSAAKRLAPLQEVPRRLLVKLAISDIAVAEPILAETVNLGDCELAHVITQTEPGHWRAIARRKRVSEAVALALVEAGDPETDLLLTSNTGASLPDMVLDILVERSRDDTRLVAALMKRIELQPAGALTMFWWAGPEERRQLLVRYTPERAVLIDGCADLFRSASQEGWADPIVRKALQVIERRQRNRAAIARSPFESLEAAIEAAADTGLTRELAQEISHLSGLKPVTGARILTDPGGEPLAILCKATGLKRDYLRMLWKALRRPTEIDGRENPMWSNVAVLYDTVATAKAQTALRYWNWSLTAAYQVLRSAPGETAAQPERKRAAALFGTARGE